MRLGRIVAALITAPVVAGLIYGIVLAYQVASHSGGPDRYTIVFTSVTLSLVALAFVVLVLLPLSLLVRKSPRFRLIIVIVGAVAWFFASALAFIVLGKEVSVAASTAIQLLAIGVPTVVRAALRECPRHGSIAHRQTRSR